MTMRIEREVPKLVKKPVLRRNLRLALKLALTLALPLTVFPARSWSRTGKANPSTATDPAGVRYPVEVNTATEDQLQSLRGIGPAMAARILAERSRAPFRSLADFDERVKGIGPASLRRLIADGLVLATPAAGSGLLQAGAVATRGPARPMGQQFQGGGVVSAPHGRVLGPP